MSESFRTKRGRWAFPARALGVTRATCLGVMAALLAGCAHSRVKLSSGELIAMKERGLSEDRILREAFGRPRRGGGHHEDRREASVAGAEGP